MMMLRRFCQQKYSNEIMKENDHRIEKDILQMYLIEHSILSMKRILSMKIDRLRYFDLWMKLFDEKSNQSNISTMVQAFPTDSVHYCCCLLDHRSYESPNVLFVHSTISFEKNFLSKKNLNNYSIERNDQCYLLDGSSVFFSKNFLMIKRKVLDNEQHEEHVRLNLVQE